MARPITALCALLGLVASAAPLAAQSAATTLQATVVRIDGDDVYLDAGADALAGALRLTVYRRVMVRHPLTRKALSDRFVIGELHVVQAGDALSLTRAAAPPSHAFAVGDSVDVERAATATAAAPTESTAAPATNQPEAPQPTPAVAKAKSPAPAAAPDVETSEMLRYFQVTLAQPIEYRLQVYEAYLSHYPRSRYRAFLEQELRYLRALQTAAKTPAAAAAAAPDVKATHEQALLASAIEIAPPQRAQEAAPLELAAYVRPEVELRSLIAYVRGADQKLYRGLPMQLDGHGHARVRIDAALVRAPGLSLFIEAVDASGKSAAAFASAKEPFAIEVVTRDGERAQLPQDAALRVRFSSELASFDGLSGRDYFWITEGDFLYRVRLGRLYGVRMGYGRYAGEGGTVEQLDVEQLEPLPAGFTYAFLETEFELTPLLWIALRGTLGLGRPDSDDSSEVTGGFQTRVRLGEPDGTNLVVGGELIPEIGQRALLALGWELIERVPMAAEVQVTDQPVNSDELAVRIVYEIGYRFGDRIAVALRPSYQLRTIRHAGPGLGLSATFDW